MPLFGSVSFAWMLNASSFKPAIAPIMPTSPYHRDLLDEAISSIIRRVSLRHHPKRPRVNAGQHRFGTTQITELHHIRLPHIYISGAVT